MARAAWRANRNPGDAAAAAAGVATGPKALVASAAASPLNIAKNRGGSECCSTRCSAEIETFAAIWPVSWKRHTMKNIRSACFPTQK